MKEIILGVDLGISSLGWAVIEHDLDADSYCIIDCGVRLFTAAETPKEKESPNKARRDARGIRRVLNRRRVRMNEIKRLFIANGLIKDEDLDENGGMYHGKANRTDAWKLRYEALRRKLTGSEFARVLVHIAKHRGYKFVGDEDADEESGKVKKAGAELRIKFESAGYKTVGEWLWATKGAKGKKRNKSGDYEFSIHRDFLVLEIKTIFEAQKQFGSNFASDELLSAYSDIAFFVKEPPSVENMVGNCTYFPEEKRAPKCSVTAEKFVALGKFFNTVIIDNAGNEQKIVERKSIEELLSFATSQDRLEFRHVRKFLGLAENEIFKGLTYKGKPKKPKKGEEQKAGEWEFDKADAEKKQWISLKGHAKFREVLGDKFAEFVSNLEMADKTAKILTYHKSEKQKYEQLKKIGIDEGMAQALSKISFSDFLMLSLKATHILYRLMSENGVRYDEALKYALENELLPPPPNKKSEYLPPLKDTDIAILNPTVIRAFAEFRKVANALVRRYGAFDKVHFELAREVNTKADIKGMREGQGKNEKERKEAAEWIAEYFGNATPITRKNILKKRLYLQQDGKCTYTGETIKLERLFDEGYCEVDHVLPKSRSADDSFANKVLCLASANQDKRNQTPFEWFGHDKAKWDVFEARIGGSSNKAKMGKSKVERLLKLNFDENSESAFVERNINDTRYMSKAIKTYCEKHWKLKNDDDKLRVQVRSGKLTSALRHQWGLDAKNREIHTHHAMDAIMIAFSTQGMVKRLSDYYAAKETRREKGRPIFKAPLENFRDAIDAATQLEKEENGHKRLLISRPPRASVTGAAHKETIQSPKEYKGKGLPINNGKGVCDNGDMPRVDVFTKEGKYYLVPIYVADFAKHELPNKAIVAGKDKEWIWMDDSYEFLFSLHKDDLVGLHQKSKAPIIGYFLGVHSGTGNISIKQIGSQSSFDGLGPKTAIYLKKYQIDPLGYYHEVKGERRLGTIPQEAKQNGVNERRAKKIADKKAAKGK